jgi:glucose-1-phosphatase
MEIKTLLIDIGEVLVQMNREVPLAKIERMTGFSQKEIDRRLDSSSDIHLYERGELTTDQFYDRLSSLFGLDISLEGFKEVWSNIFTLGRDHPTLISPRLFRQLKKNYQLVAFSNTNEMHFEYLLKAYSLLSEFDEYILSYEVGSVKPEARIYKAALEKADCAPSEALLVDDRTENIQMGEELGIEGVLFTDEKGLCDRLNDLEVLPL